MDGNIAKNTRSRVTNGSSLFLENLDGRTKEARRYRDLYAALCDSLGGRDNMNATQEILGRQLAAMEIIAETTLARDLANGQLEAERYINLAGAMRRTAEALNLLGPRNTGAGESLSEYVDRKHSLRGAGEAFEEKESKK